MVSDKEVGNIVTESDRAKFRAEAKEYIHQLYTQHKGDDIIAWERLLDILLVYIDAAIDHHEEGCRERHDEEGLDDSSTK